jgi:ATP-binding cassette subfamily F protein uup
MSLISAHGIEKSYGNRRVLEGASITLEARDRLGLIGVNGAGKSTLIKILLGREEPDGGEVARKRHLTSAVVEQSPRLDLEATVFDLIQRAQDKNRRIKERLDEVHALLEVASSDALEALLEEQAELTEAIERTGGWNVEHRAESAMLALDLPPKDRRAGSLSEGEARRVALATAFLEAPELLVLDEPTNHLDVEAVEWLEATLVDYPGALILVTHDRYFLDRVATRHAEIDRGELKLYDGNYSEYLAAKAEREALEARAEHKRARAIESELAWVRRRAPARTTKQRARLERFDALVAARPKGAVGEVRFRLPHTPRMGKSILELDAVQKSLGGRTLVSKLDLILKPGDRVGIVGRNGAGKSTLLRIIRGELLPDLGECRLGQNTAIAYADQRRSGLDDQHTVLEEVAGDGQHVYVGEEAVPVYGYLDGLLFEGATQRTKVGALSGGERSRVALAKALRVQANLLILDEPTNDLDLPTLRVLEEALIDYPGCALIVSHDRYFLDRVATAILAFEGSGKVVLYEGSYAQYRERAMAAASASQKAARPTSTAPAPPPPAASSPKKRSYKEERELAGIEERILEAESRVSALEAELNDPALLRTLGAELPRRVEAMESARREVEALYARWAELDAR